jgi:hypothetical protein
MEKFVFLFKGGEYPIQPESEQQAHLQKWMNWSKQLVDKGIMLASERLQYDGKRLSGKNKSITDGPFTESKEMVGGFTMIKANDMAEAMEVAKGCPIYEANGTVEVRGVIPM